MRYMIIVKSVPAFEAQQEGRYAPDPQVFAEMAAYHEELARAGVLLDGNGLKPTRRGWRMRYDGAHRTVTDGPFTESKELIAGYTLIQVATRAEAMEWARRFPNPVGAGQPAEIEVRELFEPEDFAPAEAQRLRAADAANNFASAVDPRPAGSS